VKVLVTGASGFLGTAFVERLLARGEKDIRCLLRSGSPRARLEEIARRHPDARVELFTGSLSNKEAARW
jgi:nucleoside-diphosphate-sugar epimerase